MSDHGGNNMHGDSFASGTYAASGPLGRHPTVLSASFGAFGGLCAAVTFDAQGRIRTVCGSLHGFELRLLDPIDLTELTSLELPQRPSTLQAILTFDPSKIFTDTSGGAYFYLDQHDRVVLVDAEQRLRVIALLEDSGAPRFVDVKEVPLSDYLVGRDCFSFPRRMRPRGPCDVVTAVMPDWDGFYWWVSRLGVVGIVDPDSGRVSTMRLEGEEIQNSFATAPDGVFIVSDHAMYGMRRGADSRPEVVWRQPYTRASASRPGQINLGSGTSPTLVGKDLVAITDADDPVNVLFIDRRVRAPENRILCKVPVFDKGQSATDNSLIGYGDSVLVENNFGYRDVGSVLFGRSVPGGVVRVDISPDRRSCHVVWRSAERSPSTVPKLSRGNGLVYLYTKDPQRWGIDAWYLTAVDFQTGRTVYKVLTGTGWNYDNLWAPITIGPDGTAYVGVFNGLLAVRDAPLQGH